ncbi:hypothetical protein Q7P37_006562 [Cladosporium fusiforme]
MSKLLVVTGATGFQGRSVINWFQQNWPSWTIRGLTRNPASENAVKLAKDGVEIAQADFDNVESLKDGFAGADYIFAYTDFASIMKGPKVMGKFKAGELTGSLGIESSKIEFEHGKNIADAAASVLGLKRLVWSALPHVKRLSNGRYSQVYHFDAKAEVFEYMLGLEALQGKVSAAHMGAFMTNAINKLELFAIEKVEDGSVQWRPPYSPDTTVMPFIDIEKDAGAFIKALIDAPAPTQLLCVSESLTPRQWMDIWSKTTGITGCVGEIPAEQFVRNDSTGFKQSVLETGLFVRDFSFTGGDEQILMPEDLIKKGYAIERTLFVDYASRENWSKILA